MWSLIEERIKGFQRIRWRPIERRSNWGRDYVEIDVRTTRDGVLVSVHDATIDRYVTTGKTGRVDGMTLQELKELDIGSRVGPQFAEERIPTLEEIFALCRGKIGIYLDMKAADLAQVYRLVHDFEMEKEMLWYIPSRQVAELRSLSLELLPMPDPGPIDRLDALLKETQPPVVAAVWRHFSQEFVERCHASDAIVIVDEGGKESWPSALAWGVDGIQTDHPKELIEFLDKQL